MNRQYTLRAAVAACVLASASTLAQAVPNTFDFSSVSGQSLATGDTTVGVTVNLTNGGTATFFDPGLVSEPFGPDFNFAAGSVAGVSGLNAPVVLTDSGGNANGGVQQDQLDISFSAAQSGFAFNFALGNIASSLSGGTIATPGDSLVVNLYNGSNLVGTDTYVTTTSNDYGVYNYTGGYGAVTSITLNAVTSSAELGAANYATVNLEPVPEPGTWAMMVAGLMAVAGIARRRSAVV